MSEKIEVPVLGESITEATVAKWLKNTGDAVEADEPIVELETDKVNLEVPSPITGVLTEITAKDGSVVEVGALLGSVSEGGSDTIKTEEINFPKDKFKELGYESYIFGQKRYNGVAFLSKVKIFDPFSPSVTTKTLLFETISDGVNPVISLYILNS